VADNGKGIGAATLPRIFEPLFTTKVGTGSGLGLWVSKQLIDKHGGSIRVRTRTYGEHRGTVFSIFLPAEGAPAAKIATASS
jgi:signal transduction histidine kinase